MQKETRAPRGNLHFSVPLLYNQSTHDEWTARQYCSPDRQYLVMQEETEVPNPALHRATLIESVIKSASVPPMNTSDKSTELNTCRLSPDRHI